MLSKALPHPYDKLQNFESFWLTVTIENRLNLWIRF